MLISEADATWAADEFINYFGNFTSIEDYLRFVKRELVPKTNPLMSHEDEFFNEDISPEEMEFEIRFIGDRFPNSLPQDHYKNLLAAVSSHNNESNIPGRELRWMVYEKRTQKIIGFIRFGSPTINSKPRNLWLGQPANLSLLNRHTAMGFVIVPSQPFGYNFLGGKLLALLCVSHFARETLNKVFEKDIAKDYRYTRSKIGIAAQELSVDWFFTIEKLLYFQAGYYGISTKKAKTKVDELLERLGLDKKRDSRLRQLSGGMKRRFQIAKALVHDPDILILDEPTAGVDVELRHDLWKYLKELHKKGKTILLTTHYIEEAELLCDNVAIIDEGTILKEGSPKQLTKELGKSGVTVQTGKAIQNIENLLTDLTYTIEDSRLHFSVDDAEKAIPNIIQKLSKINIPIHSITTETSSLEDVFLDLTGKSINE